MKKWILVISLLLVLFGSVAVSFAADKSSDNNFQMVGGFGATSIDGVIWYNLTFIPELTFGKLGVGLYIQLLYNDESGIREEDWNGWQKWSQVLYYVRWAEKGDPLYIRLGALTDTTLGHGSIIGHYNNQLDIDNRKIGLEFDMNMNYGVYGFETMTNDVLKARVMGARGYVYPFPNTLFLDRLGFGATYATDINPDDNNDTKNDGVAVGGADVEIPLVETNSFSMLAYDDLAKIRPEDSLIRQQFEDRNSDWGNAAGLMGDIFMFGYKVERRNFRKHFIAPYFDAFYEVERPTKLATLLANDRDLKGWYGELSYSIMGLSMMLSYENYEGGKPRMHGEATLKGAIPNISLKTIYDKKEIDNFPKDLSKLDHDSILTTEIGYNIAPHVQTVLIYRQAFDKYGKVAKTSSMQTRFTF
jgi:hypothetical protein